MAVRDDDASDNVAAGVAGRADNTPAGIAATGRASERDWLASLGRTADSYAPWYPLPTVDPLSSRWKPLYCITADIIPVSFRWTFFCVCVCMMHGVMFFLDEFF